MLILLCKNKENILKNRPKQYKINSFLPVSEITLLSFLFISIA